MWDPLRISSDQIFRLFYLIHQAALLEEETQVRGVVIIMDFEGMGMKHVKALSPSFSFKILGFIQDAMPLRLKEIHMVKQPLVFKMVWTIFKPVIREKLRNRVCNKKLSNKSLLINIFIRYFFMEVKCVLYMNI